MTDTKQVLPTVVHESRAFFHLNLARNCLKLTLPATEKAVIAFIEQPLRSELYIEFDKDIRAKALELMKSLNADGEDWKIEQVYLDAANIVVSDYINTKETARKFIDSIQTVTH